MNFLKRIAIKILNGTSQKRKDTFVQKKMYSNIIESEVQFPEQLDASATVQYSQVYGDVTVGKRSLIHKTVLGGKIIIGNNTTINGPSEFNSIEHTITIGNFCSIARGTAIQEHNHNMEALTTYFIKHRVFGEPFGVDAVSKGGVTIGNDVWIGTQCTIVSGVTIGDGAVIAANSVVKGDVPPYAIFGGTPAKLIRYRFSPDIIERLLQLEWWYWDIEKIKKNKQLFYNPVSAEALQNIV